MTNAAMREPALADQLAAPLTVADPDVVGALCVFPLIADRAPKLDYVAFAEGRRRGVAINELAGGAEVGDLVVHNPLELPVLLYEGEEIQGAQQNRTVDISVLVAAAQHAARPGQLRRAGPLGPPAPRRAVRARPAGRLPRAAPAQERARARAARRRRAAARRPGRGLAGDRRQVGASRRALGHRRAA